MDLYVRLCRDEVGCQWWYSSDGGGKSYNATLLSFVQSLVSKRSKNHLEQVSLYSQKTLLDRERDREIMKVNLITLIILKATLVSSCWWKKSEQVVKRRAYPVTKSRNNPPRPSLPKPTKGTSF